MEPKKENLNKQKMNIKKINQTLDKIYIKKEHKSKECNCLCCKYSNDFWRPYKSNPTSLNTTVKRIKFKKSFYCNQNCLNCKKYIHKKEQQWQEYMISSGLEFDEATKQPKIKNLQIDISNDSKNEVSKKIKDLNEKDFQKLDTKGDGNCLLRAILKSTGNNELRFPE